MYFIDDDLFASQFAFCRCFKIVGRLTLNRFDASSIDIFAIMQPLCVGAAYMPK
jgi:hypothetical protein